MGLDMYLKAKRYLSSFEDSPDTKLSKGIQEILKVPYPIQEITIELGHWRKANAIHTWFVEHVQNGEDECHETYVEREQLQELLDTVNKVLEDQTKGPELLPTQGGFFFGGTDYGEYYIECLNDTKEILEKALNDPTLEKCWDFYYKSSW